jgi:hypothetical protein
MTFTDFWAECQALGMECDEARRLIAKSAWDAALCAAQAAAHDQGKLRPAAEICQTLSELHTWSTPH